MPDFLTWMGRDYDGLFRGSDCFIDKIEDNNEFLEEILREDGIIHVPKEARVCFFVHQGYVAAWFFAVPEIDDPQCFYCTDSDDPLVIRSMGTFSEFLLEEMNQASR